MDEKKMNLNTSYPVCMDNDLITGKQCMGLNEAKLLRLAIMQVVKEDADLKTYKVRIIDLATALGIPSGNLYRDVRDMCKSLMTQVVIIGDHTKPKKAWKMFQWVSCAEYDGNGTITIALHDSLKPYLLGLSQWYTTYSCDSILAMKSVFAIRLFELIRAEMRFNGLPPKEGIAVMLYLDNIRKACDCEKTFKQFGQFREKVIDISLREINEKTGFKMSYNKESYVKEGKKVIGIRFIVKSKFADVVLSPERKEKLDSFLEKKEEKQYEGQITLYDVADIVPAWKEKVPSWQEKISFL